MLIFGPVARNKCSATKCKQLYLSPFGITHFVLKKNPANFQSSCANKSVAQVYNYRKRSNKRPLSNKRLLCNKRPPYAVKLVLNAPL